MHRCIRSLQVPVLVSELDLECKLWIKLRLAPLPPHVGTISLAFVGQPTVRVQLAPYNRVRLMRIPILQVLTTQHALHTVLVCRTRLQLHDHPRQISAKRPCSNIRGPCAGPWM
jgi:hypothetical protein